MHNVDLLSLNKSNDREIDNIIWKSDGGTRMERDSHVNFVWFLLIRPRDLFTLNVFPPTSTALFIQTDAGAKGGGMPLCKKFVEPVLTAQQCVVTRQKRTI